MSVLQRLVKDEIFLTGGKEMGERKVKYTAYLTNRINKSHDEQSTHMILKQSETDH